MCNDFYDSYDADKIFSIVRWMLEHGCINETAMLLDPESKKKLTDLKKLLFDDTNPAAIAAAEQEEK
jgi:hypothetical protein